jgi:hypothetical protein
MRGIDYRASKYGITQIIATSFNNKREALQGQERVGRFGDPCLRVSIEGVPLIDKERESLYHASLFQYLIQHESKSKITARPQKDKKTNKEEEKDEKKENNAIT